MSKVLECRGVEKVFHDGSRELRILTGVDLELELGRSHAISGASGAGKSTLLHMMGTLDRPTAGEISFDGVPYSTMGRGAMNRLRNKSIGFVFQFYHLLPEFTALENVMMPGLALGRSRASCRPRADGLLRTVGLADRMTHKPGQLSGGEQQRVAIARALYNEPRIILADEPTGNLDERTGAGIIDLLWNLNVEQNVTLVLVTHDKSLAAKADAWYELHEGRATRHS